MRMTSRLRLMWHRANQTVDDAIENLLRDALDQPPRFGGQTKFTGGYRLVGQTSSMLNVTSLLLHEGPATWHGLH
jgi:hypothetical protein